MIDQSPANLNLPRTLILDLAVGYGGSSSRVLSLLRSLASEGVALAGLARGAVITAAREQGLSPYSLGTAKTDPRLAIRLARLIRSQKFQVLDTQNIQSKFWGSLGVSGSQVALVSTLNSWYGDEHGGGWKGQVYSQIERLTNRTLDLYIVVSDAIRRRLLERDIPAEAIELVPNAVEVDLTAIKLDQEGLRRATGLPNNALVCCAVGRLVSAKGYEDLIAAFSKVAAGRPDLYCLIVGEGPLYDPLSAQIKSYGLESRIRLLGGRTHNDALSIMRSADIFVMPSHSEGTPIALLEAGALGLPILASRAGGIPEQVADGQQALLVNVGDVSALAQNLLQLAADPILRQRLAKQAQLHVAQAFSLQTQIESTKRAYRKAWQRAQVRCQAGHASRL